MKIIEIADRRKDINIKTLDDYSLVINTMEMHQVGYNELAQVFDCDYNIMINGKA
jgi:hypothetical protein